MLNGTFHRYFELGAELLILISRDKRIKKSFVFLVTFSGNGPSQWKERKRLSEGAKNSTSNLASPAHLIWYLQYHLNRLLGHDPQHPDTILIAFRIQWQILEGRRRRGPSTLPHPKNFLCARPDLCTSPFGGKGKDFSRERRTDGQRIFFWEYKLRWLSSAGDSNIDNPLKTWLLTRVEFSTKAPFDRSVRYLHHIPHWAIISKTR